MSEGLFPNRWAKDRPPSLEKFASEFADDYACAESLATKRWKNGFKCPSVEAIAPGGLKHDPGSGNVRAPLFKTTETAPEQVAVIRPR